MGGKASKTREREVVYARLPHGGAAGSAAAVSTGGAAEPTSSISAGARARATLNAQTKQSRDARTRSREKPTPPPHGARARESRGTVAYSQNNKPSRPWTPQPPASPHSTTFTVSTADSLRLNGRASRRLSSSSSSSSSGDVVEPPPSKPTNKTTMSDHHNNHASHAYGSGHVQRLPENERRIIEAEKILEEIAKEYAAKRAAGLVPTKPVPARTLLWEELARNRTQSGRRGQCIFGRDTDNICGCTSYKKKRVSGQENTGGVCECCNHGAAWHRLVGGTMARSSRMSRSIIGSSVRASRLESAASSYVPSEARSSAYDYDSDEDYDDDEDDEAIANEIAVPSSFYPVQAPAPSTPALQSQSSSSQGGMDRLSLLSIGSSYGFPSRLSSATNSLGALLQAIQRYRDMGLDEDEIEVRIRLDFPPVPRKSSLAARSDTSMSPVDI